MRYFRQLGAPIYGAGPPFPYPTWRLTAARVSVVRIIFAGARSGRRGLGAVHNISNNRDYRVLAKLLASERRVDARVDKVSEMGYFVVNVCLRFGTLALSLRPRWEEVLTYLES